MNTVKDSNVRYAEIYDATIAAVGEELFKKYYKDTGNKWLDIAKLWNRCYRKPLHAVFFYVFHKIFWGMYPDVPLDDKFMHLLKLVESEVLTGTESHDAWYKWRIFKDCYSEVIHTSESYGKEDVGISFIEHHLYLINRASIKILRGKLKGIARAKTEIDCELYEASVSRLIPASTSWDSQKWGDDTNISKAIEGLYGVYYADSHDKQMDYNRIVCMLNCDLGRNNPNSDFYWYAANIRLLPIEMAQAIWPQDYKAVIVSTYIEAYKRTKTYIENGAPYAWKKSNYMNPVGHYELAALKESWLNKLIQVWLAAGENFGQQHDIVRNVAFNIALSD